MRKIIDCHCHVYPDKIAEKASVAIGEFYGIDMNYDGRLETMLADSDKAGITHSLIFSVATKPSQTRSINEFIARTVSQNPDRFTGLGTLHPESEDLEGDVDHLISLDLRGVKLHPDIQGFKIDDYRCLKIYELCEKKGLPVLFHTGDTRYDYSNPNRIKPILDIYKNLTVIGAHLGGYSLWEEATNALAGEPNFYVDCSSTMAFLPSDKVTELIKRYGADKVIYGTDYPMWDIKEELERFDALGLSDEERELILYKNAQKLFNIKLNCVENDG